MGLGSIVGKLFRSGPLTEEVVGDITDVRIDPQGDGKSVVYRISSMPRVEFRQRSNVMSSAHKQGDHVKVVYSLTAADVATVDYVQQI